MTDTMKEANSINIMPADVEEVRRSLGQIKKAIQASKMDVVYNASVGAGNPALAWLLIWIGNPIWENLCLKVTPTVLLWVLFLKFS